MQRRRGQEEWSWGVLDKQLVADEDEVEDAYGSEDAGASKKRTKRKREERRAEKEEELERLDQQIGAARRTLFARREGSETLRVEYKCF